MNKEQLADQIGVILKNNGYMNTDGKVTPGTTVFNLANLLASRLIHHFDKPTEQSNSPLVEKKSNSLEESSNLPKPISPAYTEPINTFPELLTPHKESIVNVGIQLGFNAVLPQYAKPYDAGIDLVANFANEEDYNVYASKFGKVAWVDYIIVPNDKTNCEDYAIYVLPGHCAPIPTGIYMEIPIGRELQIRPRSGHATKLGLVPANTPGTIDATYRGEVIVVLYNHSIMPQLVEGGMKVAQGVFAPVDHATFTVKDELSKTARGEGGFNSTGSNIKID